MALSRAPSTTSLEVTLRLPPWSGTPFGDPYPDLDPPGGPRDALPPFQPDLDSPEVTPSLTTPPFGDP